MKKFRLLAIAILIMVMLPSAKTDKQAAASLMADESLSN